MTAVAATRLSRALVLLFAFTAGAAVANIYYVQPLLDTIGHEFGVGEGAAGLLVTSGQIGYLLGLALIVPLGDLIERRRLITGMLVLAGAASALCAAAPGLVALAAGLAVLALVSVVAQIVVALTAVLAAPGERGQVVGTVMSGLLCGILAARTLSGVVADLGGWRLVFAVGAAIMLVLAVVVARVLPAGPRPEPSGAAPSGRAPSAAGAFAARYGALLRSVVGLVREQPVLRQRMVLAACGMAGFSVLWTTIAFLLASDAYGYSEAVIGLFGLAGVAGALMAPLAGRISDRGHGVRGLSIALATIAVSWAVLWWGGTALVPLLVGIVVIDLGLTAAQIQNQHRIYELDESARSRVTTAFMVAAFTGGALGSAAGASAYAAWGWDAACALGFAFAAIALTYWTATAARGRS
jgi:predicted MFS family arabinose efflux permease